MSKPPKLAQAKPADVVDFEDFQKDVDVGCAGDRPPLIPEGDYEVGFVRPEETHLWGRKKLFLHFQTVETGDYHGTVLFMSMNLPTHGRLSRSSKFFQSWVLAAGKEPNRLDRMSTRIFRGKIFLARVRTVTTFIHASRKVKKREPTTFYSIIDHLIERRAGA